MKAEQQTSEKLLHYLVGQIMKKTQGRANPQVARQVILERLDALSTEVST